MINIFGTNNVVPNGYIYKTHKGSEYIFLEGFWFNHSNLKMVDPAKTTKMNEAASAQILKHNSTGKQMIGESFSFTGNDYVYLGEGRFTENGVIVESSVLTELMADDDRVYKVSRETLNKEWATLNFYILPPHAEDVSIPAGLEVEGFKFVPKGQRFIDMQTGRPASPEMTRKLHAAGMRLARQQATSNQLVPINSTLKMGNAVATWNGKDFCDNDGNVVVPAAQASNIFSKYKQFVHANPNDFQSLVQDTSKEQRFGVGEKPVQKQPVTEADEEGKGLVVPNGYTIVSKSQIPYYKKNGEWISTKTKKPINSSAAKSVERAAQVRIAEYNKSAPVKIGEEWTSSKGKTYTYVGDDRFISTDGKLIPKDSAKKILAKLEGERKVDTDSPLDTKDKEPKVQDAPNQDAPKSEPEVQSQEEPKQDAPKSEPTPSSTENSELSSLADAIKQHPKARKITVLMTRGDKVSLLAADLILAGKEQDAIKILKALNSNDE